MEQSNLEFIIKFPFQPNGSGDRPATITGLYSSHRSMLVVGDALLSDEKDPKTAPTKKSTDGNLWVLESVLVGLQRGMPGSRVFDVTGVGQKKRSVD
jgi:hypothetical protein